ncbi:hypothetical protein [Paenibacillus spongiae]|uniref:Uncharacterized protein n=1 Tax=Paenibacillus spongiae TaxID=2909671 RepID=A0ABY5S3W3_9BACL|nr:hypothetical protein [Paenibacillus spongiae]UVI28596.1 hypothetical protein L1F29_24560 [Paenibacillus spongiae]
MEYRTATLTPDAVTRLQQLESDLSNATGSNIVLIAYTEQEEGKGNRVIYDSTIEHDHN